MTNRSRSLPHVRSLAALACTLLACCGPAEPNDDGTGAQTTEAQTTGGQTTTASATASSSQSGSSTVGVDGSESGPPECTVANYDCPAGFACSQLGPFEPPFCEPIPEGGCTAVDPCPDGFTCMSGSHHTEIGECEPIDESSSSGSSSGSSGSSGTG